MVLFQQDNFSRVSLFEPLLRGLRGSNWGLFPSSGERTDFLSMQASACDASSFARVKGCFFSSRDDIFARCDSEREGWFYVRRRGGIAAGRCGDFEGDRLVARAATSAPAGGRKGPSLADTKDRPPAASCAPLSADRAQKLGAGDPSDQNGTTTTSTVVSSLPLEKLARTGVPAKLAPQFGFCRVGK